MSSENMPHVDPPEAKSKFGSDTDSRISETCKDQSREFLQEYITKKDKRTVSTTGTVLERHFSHVPHKEPSFS
jgi:hypothetical protein